MSWSPLPQHGDKPGPRSSHTLTCVGDALYMFGGELKPRVPVDNAVFSFELATSTWKQLSTSGSAPCPRVAATACAVGPCIYVFGGRTGIEMGEGSLNDLHVFDTRSLAWSQLTPAAGQVRPLQRGLHQSIHVSLRVLFDVLSSITTTSLPQSLCRGRMVSALQPLPLCCV